MNYDRLTRPDAKKAERYRVIAYLSFFLCLTALLFGVVPAMYYGSGWWVLATLLAAGAFFFVAFFAGGIGWSRFEVPQASQAKGSSGTRKTGGEGFPYETQTPLAPPEESRPYAPPEPSDQNRPPIE